MIHKLSDLAVSINGRPTMSGEAWISCQDVDTAETGGPIVIDPAWSEMDTEGHYHAVTDDGGLPTLAPCQRPVGVGEDGTPELAEYYRCVICHEVIKPRTKIKSRDRSSIPGLTEWTVQSYAVPGQYRVMTGERVSLVLRTGCTRLFGVAEIMEVTASGRSDLLTVDLRGVGDLGRRTVRPS